MLKKCVCDKNKAHMTTMNKMKYAVFSAKWPTGAEIQLGKLAVGGFHKPKHIQTFRPGIHIFKGELLTVALFFR